MIEHPQRSDTPLTTPDEHNFQPYTTIERLVPRRWRLYYNALEKDAAGLDTSQAAMLFSSDGVHWGGMRLLDLPTPVWGASIIHERCLQVPLVGSGDARCDEQRRTTDSLVLAAEPATRRE